jgi:hypothetical protein
MESWETRQQFARKCETLHWLLLEDPFWDTCTLIVPQYIVWLTREVTAPGMDSVDISMQM